MCPLALVRPIEFSILYVTLLKESFQIQLKVPIQ